jgi:hypothetical protein
VEHDGRHPGRGEHRRRDERVRDVAHRHRAARAHLGHRVGDRRHHRRIVRALEQRAQRHELPDPGEEVGTRRHASAQPREFEMGMRVDETRQDDRRAEVLDLGHRRRLGPAPHGGHAAVHHVHPGVAQRRLIDRAHPGGAQQPPGGAGGHRRTHATGDGGAWPR